MTSKWPVSMIYTESYVEEWIVQRLRNSGSAFLHISFAWCTVNSTKTLIYCYGTNQINFLFPMIFTQMPVIDNECASNSGLLELRKLQKPPPSKVPFSINSVFKRLRFFKSPFFNCGKFYLLNSDIGKSRMNLCCTSLSGGTFT